MVDGKRLVLVRVVLHQAVSVDFRTSLSVISEKHPFVGLCVILAEHLLRKVVFAEHPDISTSVFEIPATETSIQKLQSELDNSSPSPPAHSALQARIAVLKSNLAAMKKFASRKQHFKFVCGSVH